MVTMNIQTVEKQVIGSDNDDINDDELTPVFSTKVKNPAYYVGFMKTQYIESKSDLVRDGLRLRCCLSQRRFVKFLYHIQKVLSFIDSLPEPSLEDSFVILRSE